MNELTNEVAKQGAEGAVEAVAKSGKGTGILIGVATAIGVVAAVKGVKTLFKRFSKKKEAAEAAPETK